MLKIFGIIIEGIGWLLLFLSPTLAAGIIALAIYLKDPGSSIISLVIAVTGAVTGILFAERIRRKYGCINFFSGTPSKDKDEPGDV